LNLFDKVCNFEKKYMAKEKKIIEDIIAAPKIEGHLVLESLIAETEACLLKEAEKEEAMGAIALQLRNVLQLISNAKRSYEQYLRNK
jgi:hypothetical protein